MVLYHLVLISYKECEIKVLYLTYENVYRTAILQAMVIKPLDLLNKKYNIDFVITSSVKPGEKNGIYFANKKNVLENTNLNVVEFEKKLDSKQSIFTFVKDIFPMIMFAIKEARNCDVIHCRSYGAAIIGFIASMITKKPYIFDMRGVLPEETVDVGKFSKKSFKYKLLKFAEKILISHAAYVFTVSNKFNDYIRKNFNKKECININNPTDFSSYYKLEKKDRRVNFIYSGSMQVWHLPELTIQYFKYIYEHFGDKVYLYFCTNDKEKAQEIFKKFDLPSTAYEINTVPFKEMPKYYAKSDIAFCFIQNSFSKSVCFPVKFSEYIASELYVLANSSIGDLEEIIKKYKCGIAFENLNNIDQNIDKIIGIVQSMLNGEYVPYDRKDLNFLDWESGGIDKIYDIYKKLKEENRDSN